MTRHLANAMTATTSPKTDPPKLREVARSDVFEAPLSVQEEVHLLRRRLARINRAGRRDASQGGQLRRVLCVGWCLLVLIPVMLTYAYLGLVATPQFYSVAGFTTRAADPPQALDSVLPTFAFGTVPQSTENDILYAYLQSQELVSLLQEQIDLKSHFQSGWARDPLFLLHPDTQQEDLRDFWARISEVAYDPANGLIQIRIRARDPTWAAQVLSLVIAASEDKVNAINATAFADAVRHAEERLEQANTDWRQARKKVQDFRVAEGIVDPAIEIESHMGVLTSLQHQLAAALIDLDEMGQTTDVKDPRVRKLSDRVAVIRARLAEERLSFSGRASGPGVSFPALVSRYEALTADLEFAQLRYSTALAEVATARTEAAQNSRYLAVYLSPTTAETAEFPKIHQSAGLVFVFGALFWAIFAMIYLSVRGRR